MYKDAYGTLPKDYLVQGVYTLGGGGDTVAIEDYAYPTSESHKAFIRSMQDLVDANLLTAIPKSTGGEPYAYFKGVFFSQTEAAVSPNAPNTCQSTPAFYECNPVFYPPEYPGTGRGCYPYSNMQNPIDNVCETLLYESWLTAEQIYWCRDYVLANDAQGNTINELDQQHDFEIFGDLGGDPPGNVGIMPCGVPGRGEICSCTY
jgi:hypothetical protein